MSRVKEGTSGPVGLTLTEIDGSAGVVGGLSGGGKVAGLNVQSGTRLRLQHLSGATGLIATYLIEIGVQIFLTLHCWRSLGLVYILDWSSFLILSTLITSLLVTTVSMVWVCRGLDFVGRACARLLCYILHFTLLGLLWRYLKLAFAYDHADVQEFVALRVFQVYIQSLPLTSIHLAWLITFPHEMYGQAFWVIMAEILSIIVALTLSAYIKSANSPIGNPDIYLRTINLNEKTTPPIYSDNLKCSVYSLRVNWCQVLKTELNTLSRMMLLLCRLLIVGILIAHLKLWSILAILLHFVITSAWICRVHKMAPTSFAADEETATIGSELVLSVKESLVYIFKYSYIFFWDVFSVPLQGSIDLSTWILPAIVVTLENGGLLVYYSYTAEPAELIVILTCTGCLVLGIPIFLVLNFCTSRTSTKDGGMSANSNTTTTTSTAVPSPEIDEFCCTEEKNGWKMEITSMPSMTNGGRGSWDLNLTNSLGLGALEKGKPLIMANNYTNISEVLMSAGRTGIPTPRVNETNIMSISEKTGKNLGGGDTGTWVPDTCCNDSNGSSNSRNTNTLSLLEPKDVAEEEIEEDEADDMVLDNPPFVFYFPEHTTLRHHSVVRKLSLQSEKGVSVSATHGKSKSRSNRASPVTSVESQSQRHRHIIRTSTPVQIKEAATRVIVNYPKHNHYHSSAATAAAVVSTIPSRSQNPSGNRSGSRCHCHKRNSEKVEVPVPVPEVIDPFDPYYEKLMEDPYGILICEGDQVFQTQTRRPNPMTMTADRRNPAISNSRQFVHGTYPMSSQKLKVLCAKCLQNHDPLLTNCSEDTVEHVIPSRLEPRVHTAHVSARVPRIPAIHASASVSDTTEYPSETEMTWTAAGDDQLSVSSHLSTATYTTWPRKTPQHSMSMWATATAAAMMTATSTNSAANSNPKEFTSREYVRTWLLTSEARAKHYYNEYGHSHGGLKRVHRSRTISTGAGGAVSRGRITSSHYHGHAHKTLGKRHGPVGRGQSPESMDQVSRPLPLPLVLTPPPKRKQHPIVLPLDYRACAEISTRHHHHRPRLNNNNRSRSVKAFYKDLEIIV